MTRIRIAAAAVVAALVAGAGLAAAAAHTTKLTAFVSDPAKIGLTQGGKTVKTLKAGTYQVAVKDTSVAHNFHLTGPGVNKSTSVSAKQTVTWTVKLKKGTYKYVCDPHSSFMKGSFKVT